MTLEERIKAPGQKKILALDGGGICGIMTVEVPAGIEKILREKEKALMKEVWDEDFCVLQCR